MADKNFTSVTPFVFPGDGKAIRSLILPNGEPGFVGKDVAERLGYADTVNAIKRHCKGVAIYHPLPTAGGLQDVRILTEPDVLRLIVSSSLPAAQEFERWVFEDVLPSIRRTGGYTMQPQKTSSAEDMETMRVLADALRLEGSARLDVMSRAMAIVAPHLLPAVPVYAIDAPTGSISGSSETTASLTTLLKRNGHKVSAAACNVALKDLGILEAKSRPSTKGVAYFWSLTDAGLRYGKNVSSPKNQRETQPHWYESKFGELAHLLRIEGVKA
jgi:prophage antirepressor-like protein